MVYIEKMSCLITKKAEIITLDIPANILKRAQEESHKGSMNNHSLLKGERNVAALAAELMVKEYFPILMHNPTKNYDLTHQFDVGTLTIDVKNKFDVKRINRTPELDWDCTIFGYEAEKSCHLYLFTSTNEDNTKIWFKGFISKLDLVSDKNLYEAGSFRTTTQGSIKYKRDNYVIQVKDLSPISLLSNILSKKS